MIPTIALAILTILIGLYLGIWLHEGTHWTIGKLYDSGANFRYKKFIIPCEVRHQELSAIPDTALRISGGLPILYLTLSPISVVYSLRLAESVAVSYFMLFLGFPAFLMAGGMMSESDVTAMKNPDKYRKKAENNGFPSNSAYLQLLKFALPNYEGQ
jgi:hypothetical protein